MSNSYAVVPNILPGNVTIGGLLTVSGDFIRIGAAAPFARVGKTTGGAMFLSQNLGNDLVTRDSGAALAAALSGSTALPSLLARLVNAAGAANDGILDATIAQDGTLVTVTGTIVETTTRSKVIRANLLGVDGMLFIQSHLAPTAQGGVATVVQIKFGGVAFLTYSSVALGERLFRLFLFNRNAANVQNGLGIFADNAGFTRTAVVGAAVDTTVDQTLAVTVTPGAVGDSWRDYGWKVYGMAGAAGAF